MLLLLAASLLAEPMVSLTVPATSVGTILKTVSASVGAELTADPRFLETPLIVAVNNVSLSEFLAKAAFALDAEVRPSEKGFRIYRAPKRQQELLELERLEREKRWSSALVRRRKDLEKNPWSHALAEKMLAQEKKRYETASPGGDWMAWIKSGPHLDDVKPSSRLLFKLLESMGPKELSRYGPNSRVVFSRYPTDMQVAMPSKLEAWIRQYELESQQNPPREYPTEMEEEGEITFSRGRMSAAIPFVPKLVGGVGKVHLILENGSASLNVYSAKGDDCDAGQFQDYSDWLDEEPTAEEPPDKRLEGLKPIQFSALSKDFREFCAYQAERYDDEGNAVEELKEFVFSAELRAFLVSPEVHDPLSLTVSEALLSYANQKKLNLIANLSDSFADTDMFYSEEGEAGPELKGILESIFASSKEQQGVAGWCALQPLNTLAVERQRQSRSNVGRFTRTVLKNGPSLQAEIQFASGLNDEQVTGWYSSRLPQLKYLQMLIGASAINESEQMGVARFLSTLQPFQLQQLLNGRTMTLENMSPEQSRQLTRHFYDGEAGWSRIETEPEPEVEPETGESFAARLSLDRFGEVSEPTELLPSGIPRSTTLSIKSKRENKFLSSSMPMSAKSIAAAMLCQKKGFLEEEFMGDITKEFLVSKVKPVTRFEHIVTFSFSPKTHSDSAFIYQIPRFAKREVTLDDPLMKGEIDYWIKKLDGLSKEELIRSMFSGDEDGG